MPYIFLATPTFDLNGHVALKQTGETELRSNTRRVSRTATLDGGALFSDGGYSDADRSISVTYLDLSETDEAALWSIFESYPLILLSAREGCFYGAISNLKAIDGSGSFTFLVKEKKSS
jgi:hypothetical protein